MIKLSSLSHTYSGGKKALNDINIEIPAGVFGLLGPNGAGKTTLMEILVTLMNSSSGSITINGLDIQRDREKIRSMIGYLPQSFSTFSKLKTREFLKYSASLAGIKSNKVVNEMLERVGLSDSANILAEKLSGGMKRRLGIAHALIGNPSLVVVDEPTTGLDPEERLRFRNMLGELISDDRTVILSTHIVNDIASSCQQLAVLDEGEIAFNGSPSSLIERAKGYAWELTVPENELENVKSSFSVITTTLFDDGFKVQVVGDKPSKYHPLAIDPNLEHAYMWLSEQREKQLI